MIFFFPLSIIVNIVHMITHKLCGSMVCKSAKTCGSSRGKQNFYEVVS